MTKTNKTISQTSRILDADYCMTIKYHYIKGM